MTSHHYSSLCLDTPYKFWALTVEKPRKILVLENYCVNGCVEICVASEVVSHCKLVDAVYSEQLVILTPTLRPQHFGTRQVNLV